MYLFIYIYIYIYIIIYIYIYIYISWPDYIAPPCCYFPASRLGRRASRSELNFSPIHPQKKIDTSICARVRADTSTRVRVIYLLHLGRRATARDNHNGQNSS